MARYRTARTLDQATAAYLAGLVDGEGTVTLTRVHRSENRRLVVSISNNERCILEFVLNVVGVGKVTSKKTYSAHHAQSFTYQISSRQALDLLRQIQPFMKSYKAQRAVIVLNDYVRLTPRNGHYTEEARRARLEFENHLLGTRP